MRWLKIALSALLVTAMIGEPAFAAATAQQQKQQKQQQQKEQVQQQRRQQAAQRQNSSKDDKGGGFAVHAGKSKGNGNSTSWLSGGALFGNRGHKSLF